MVNSIKKGKRIERHFANKLKPYFPKVKRNLREQASDGGIDLVNTGEFRFEIKGGKRWKYKGIRDVLDQLNEETVDDGIRVALIKPDREDDYVLMDYSEFEKLLENK